MLELENKDVKTAIINMLHMFKVIEERSIKIFLKTQMELLGRKIIVSEMKTIHMSLTSD